MADASGTWVMLVRDVSGSVRVRGEQRVVAALVLDVDTGLIRGGAAATNKTEALTMALSHGLREPAGALPPGPPAAVWCAPEHTSAVEEALDGLGVHPALSEVDPPASAEDVFDSFIGHMAGRDQPDDLPEPADFGLLYGRMLEFLRAAPWERWHDGITLVVETRVGSVRTPYAVVVMGNAGIQHGLVLYPGDQVPDGQEEWEPGRPLPLAPGTLLCTLDAPGELPDELRAKARRYGWPAHALFEPALLRLDPEGGGGDPSRGEVQRTTVALAAVTAYDAHGPASVGPPRTGEVTLADGRRGRYAIQQRPAPQPDGLHLRIHEVGHEVVPEGMPVALGHVALASLAELRRRARIHRPLPAGAPTSARADVPLIVVLARGERGDKVAADIANLDPLGVSVMEVDDGTTLLVLVGAKGAEALMDLAARSPALATFQRRLRATKGVHAVMVADEESAHGGGTVYALFECLLPPPAAPLSPRAQPPKRSRSKKGHRR